MPKINGPEIQNPAKCSSGYALTSDEALWAVARFGSAYYE